MTSLAITPSAPMWRPPAAPRRRERTPRRTPPRKGPSSSASSAPIDAREDVSGSGGGERRRAAPAHPDPPVGRRHERVIALEQDDRAGRRSRLAARDPGDGRQSTRCRSRAAARARPRAASARSAPAAGERLERAGVGVQAVGVEQQRNRRAALATSRANDCVSGSRPRPGPRTSESHALGAFEHLPGPVGVESAVASASGTVITSSKRVSKIEVQRRRHAGGHVARPGPHRGLGGQARRSGQADRPAAHEHAAGGELRRLAPAPGDPVRHGVADQPDRRIGRAPVGNPDVDHRDVAGVRFAGRDPQPRLGRVKRGGGGGASRPRRRPRRWKHRRRWARRRRTRSRPRAALIASIAPAASPRGSPANPVPRIASTITAGRPRARAAENGSGAGPGRRSRLARASPRNSSGSPAAARETRGPRSRSSARDHETVAAVVALPAHDHDRSRPGRDAGHQRGQSGAGALHQLHAGDPELADRPLVERPLLRGIGKRLEPVRERHTQDRDGGGLAARVGQRDPHLDAELAGALGHRPCSRSSGGPSPSRRPRRRGSSTPPVRAPSRPPPWRRTARRDAARDAREQPRRRARRR